MTSGEIKAGIVITSILKEFPELYISRKSDQSGAVKYRVESPETSLCEFAITDEEVKITSDSSFGGGEKEREIRNQINSLLKALKIPSETIEMPVAQPAAVSAQTGQAKSTAAPTATPTPVTPSPVAPAHPTPAPEPTASGVKPINIDGVQFLPITGLVPIPSTSYVAQLGQVGESWAVGVFRGRRSIGVEKVSDLEQKRVVGAMQKIIVIPLFSPYAMSRAVDRLIKSAKEKR